MKKIVGAVVAAAMLTGTAMADIGFSYTGSNYFTSSSGNLKYDSDGRVDCLSVSLQNQFGGVVVDFDIDGSDASSKALTEDAYYGWLNFTLPAGQLQVTAGKWAGRYVKRVTADAGDLDGDDFELYKPGVINGSTGKDSDNLTGKNIAVVAAYTNTDVLPGTLMAKFGLVSSKWNPDAASATTAKESGDVKDSDITLNAGFVGEVAYRQDGLVDAVFAVKNLVKNNLSFALFVTPMMVDKLSLTVGGTVATVKNYDTTAKEWGDLGVEWGVDLRARYKITDALSVTTMNNISAGYDEKTDSGKFILWDMVNATYAIADNLSAGLTLQSVCEGFDSDHKSDCDGFDITVTPSLVIQATEKVAVTTAVRAKWTGLNLANDWENVVGGLDITIPVIFAFNY